MNPYFYNVRNEDADDINGTHNRKANTKSNWTKTTTHEPNTGNNISKTKNK